MANNAISISAILSQGHGPVSPAVWHTGEQKVVTNVISIQETVAAMDKTAELLNTFLQKVQDNEPGCQLFLLTRDDERFQYVTFEIYQNKEAVDLHLHTDYMRELLAAEDEHKVKRAGNDIHHESIIAQIGPRNMKA